MPVQGGLSVERMCRVAAVSRASFYRWLQPAAPEEEEMEVRAAIQAVVLEHRGRYGYRRVALDLGQRGLRVNHKRVLRLMREDNLLAIQPRAWTATTDSNHALEVSINLAMRMKLTGINQLWVADLTYIRLRAEFVYLAVVLDAYSRKVVGWALDRTLAAPLTLAALQKALRDRQPPPGLVHHSDRGGQYASAEYAQLLRLHQITPSMSRPANPYDNAFCESFMRTLKREEINARSYRNLEELRANLTQFLERYYNRSRMHSALGYRSPHQFEQWAASQQGLPAGECPAASMSFPRHRAIYRWDGETAQTASPAHPIDESPASYSSASCSPAEPASASPAETRVEQNQPLGIPKNSKRQVRSFQNVST